MRAFHGVIVVLILAMPAPLLAADFQTGLKAFERGDYAADMFPSANRGWGYRGLFKPRNFR